jgi:hypothetical protein
VLGTVFWLLADAWGITLALVGFVGAGAAVAIVARSGPSASSDRRPD